MTRRNRRLRADGQPVPLGGQDAQSIILTLLRLGFVGVACVGLALLAGSSWRAFVAIDALKLTTVEVRGAHRASKEALLAAAGTDYGDPLMTLDLRRAAAAMTGHPWVRSATLRRQLPNRLHIDVQEHRPKALLMLGSLWVVNTLGEPFKPFASDDGFSLPIITGIVPAGAQVPKGAAAEATDPERVWLGDGAKKERLDAALELLDAVHDLYGQALLVEQLHYDEDLGFSLYLLPQGAMSAAFGPEHLPVVAHLGQAPLSRVRAIGDTLALLQKEHMAAAVIWANGQRAPNRVQVQPYGPFRQSGAKGAEKSQSVSNRRTIP